MKRTAPSTIVVCLAAVLVPLAAGCTARAGEAAADDGEEAQSAASTVAEIVAEPRAVPPSYAEHLRAYGCAHSERDRRATEELRATVQGSVLGGEVCERIVPNCPRYVDTSRNANGGAPQRNEGLHPEFSIEAPGGMAFTYCTGHRLPFFGAFLHLRCRPSSSELLLAHARRRPTSRH